MKKSFARVPLFFIILFWLIILLIPAQTVILAQEVDYSEDFEDGQAQGWSLEDGWQVIDDGGNRVLAGEGHSWASADRSYDDYQLTFRLKLIKGSIHLVYRRNAEGRYFIGFTPSGSYLSKQYWPDDFRENLTKKTTKYATSKWHQVEIIGQGNLLTFIVDGSTEWTYTDPEPLEYGDFAFETLENSQAYIDDVMLIVSDSAPDAAPAPAAEPAAESPSAGPTQVVKDTAEILPAESLTWVRTGGPLGGLGYDVRMSPDNPYKMFVTDAYAGIFMSLNGGVDWFPSNSGINIHDGSTGDAIPVFSVTIDPSQPEIVWLGTQNKLGIYKSIDGGQSWKIMINGVSESDGTHFRGFTIDPANSDVVYAAAEISSWSGGKPARQGREFDMTRGVVYKTTDGGKNWKAIWRGENLARYIWIDPRDTNVLYISTGIFDREANNSDPEKRIPGGEGVLKSTDGGETWNPMNNGLDNLYVGSLFMHPTDPDILMAGTGNNQYYTGGGTYITKDGGASWSQVLADYAITSVEFAQSNPSIAYAGSDRFIYRSEDGGSTWKKVSGSESDGWGSPGVRGGFPIDFQVDPRDPDRIFINAYGGGNFLSEDGGKTWVDASRGYTGSMVRAISVDPTQPGRVLVGARSGLFITLNGGADWEGLCFDPINFMGWNAVSIDPADSAHFIAGSTEGDVFAQSRNHGQSWSILMRGLEQAQASWSSIVFVPSDPAVVYAGIAGYYSAGTFDYSMPGKGIYKSIDGGKTWKPSNDELTQDAHVTALAVNPQDPNMLFAATANHGLLKTTDGGASWQEVRNGLPGIPAISIAINPDDPGIMAAGFDRQALYISRDGGNTWKRSASGMPAEASLRAIIFDPSNPDEVLYAGDFFSGVYRSADGGKKWKQINNGLLNRAIQRLAISGDGLHLYATTEGGGVHRLDLNGLPPAEAPRPKQAAPTQSASTNSNSSAQEPQTVNADSKFASGLGSWLPYALAGALLVVIVILLVVIKRKK